MKPQAFFSVIQERFEMNKVLYFHPKDSTCSQEFTVTQITKVVEQFLELLGILITNRTMTRQLTTEQIIRHFFMHSLFVKPSTHSELLLNAMPEFQTSTQANII